MLSLDDIKSRLNDSRLSDVSEKTGISYQQLWRLSKNKDNNPKYETIKKLSDYFHGEHYPDCVTRTMICEALLIISYFSKTEHVEKKDMLTALRRLTYGINKYVK